MGELKDVVGISNDVIKGASGVLKAVTSGYGRRSISRLAKDAIFQMPMIISSDIDTEDAMAIAHAFEKEEAGFVVAAMALDHNVDRTKYGNTREFLKTFHNDSSVPAAVYNSGNLVLESCIAGTCEGVYVDPMMLASLRTDRDDRFDLDVVNEMYLPYVRTMRKLQDRIDIATEASGGGGGRPKNKPEDPVEKLRNQFKANKTLVSSANSNKGTAEWDGTVGTSKNKDAFYRAHPNAQRDKNLATGYATRSKFDIPVDSGQAPAIKNKEAKFDLMEPTLITVTLTNYNGQSVWKDSIVLGVKVMLRLVPSGQMVANMIDAAEDRAIFKFIKFTKGEYDVFDILFGKSKYKKMGIENAKGKWLAALKKRATVDNVSRFSGNRLLPSTSIIMTETEVLEVKRACGVDLHDMRNINQIFKKYFLLGFGIYDTNTRVLSAVFDGDSNFTHVPMSSLVATLKKETDLLANNARRF